MQRYDIERAIRRSDLPPVQRHLLLTLAMNLERGTNQIPAAYAPSIAGLAEGTGWGRRTIMRHLRHLERSGWLAIARRPGRRPGYAICPPATSDSPAPQLVTLSTATSATVAPIQGDPINHPEIAIVIEEIRKRTGKDISPAIAARTRDFILARPRVSDSPAARAAYLRKTIAQDPDPGRFMPTPIPPRFTKEKGFTSV